MKVAVIQYQYYSDYNDKLLEAISSLPEVKVKRVLITNHVVSCLYCDSVVLHHTNVGKDIGAKLIGIDYLLSTNEDYDCVFFVHDKRSPHSPLGNIWYNELIKILNNKYIKIILDEMKKERVGICCSKNYIHSEFAQNGYSSYNHNLLRKLMKDFGLNPPAPYLFVAGTIFCCKWLPLKEFFSKYNPLSIRMNLERGNVQDVERESHTHAWERMLSWILTSQGLTIKGL